MKNVLLLSAALCIIGSGCSRKYLSGDIVETYKIDENYAELQVKMKGPRKKYLNRKVAKQNSILAEKKVRINKSRQVSDKYLILRRNTPGIITKMETDSVSRIWVDFGIDTPLEFTSNVGERYTLVTDTIEVDGVTHVSKPEKNYRRKLALKAKIKKRKKYKKETKRIKGKTLE